MVLLCAMQWNRILVLRKRTTNPGPELRTVAFEHARAALLHQLKLQLSR